MARAAGGSETAHGANALNMRIRLDESTRGILAALLSSGASGIAAVFLTGATRFISPFLITLLTAICGGAGMCLFAWLRGEARLVKLRGNSAPIVRVALLRCVATALLYVLGASMTDASKVVFFTKAEPYFVLFFGWFLYRERLQKTEALLLAVHLGGALLLSTAGRVSELGRGQLGDLFIISATFLSAYTYRDSKQLSEQMGGVLAAGITNLLGAAVFGLVCLSPAVDVSAAPAFRGWAFFALHILFFQFLALPLWFAALRSVKGWMVSALRATGTLLGLPVAYLVLGERLDWIQLIGGALIVATSAVIGRLHFREFGGS